MAKVNAEALADAGHGLVSGLAQRGDNAGHVIGLPPSRDDGVMLRR